MKERKGFDKIINIFAWLSFALAMLLTGLCVFSSFSGEENGKEIFGVKLLIVASDSMSKSPLSEDEEVFFNTGDVIIIKRVSDATLIKEGDVITFVSYDKDSYGKTITHKIREVKYTAKGELIGYVTYGINTGVNDNTVVMPDSVIGIYSGKIPKVGNIFSYMKTPRGYFLSILTPCVLLIIFFSMKVGRAVGSKKLLVEYDVELDTLKKRVEELEKLVFNNDTASVVAETHENVVLTEDNVKEPPKENTVVEVYSETSTSSKLKINGTKTPFRERLLDLSLEVQEYFICLHNELSSYKRVKYRLSNKCMSYRVGKKLLAKILVRGKTLTACFALEVSAFNVSVYHQKDMSNVKAFLEVPFGVKVKSQRGKNNALKLINELAISGALEKDEKYKIITLKELLKSNDEVIDLDGVVMPKTSTKLVINGRKISFWEKILGLDAVTKNYFLRIHNELISYKKVNSRLSYKCMSYRYGRKLLAKVSVRGKTLNLYLALKASEYNENVYHQKDVSDKKAYEAVPFRVKVKSDRGIKNAIKLVTELSNINLLTKRNKFEAVNQIESIKMMMKKETEK